MQLNKYEYNEFVNTIMEKEKVILTTMTNILESGRHSTRQLEPISSRL